MVKKKLCYNQIKTRVHSSVDKIASIADSIEEQQTVLIVPSSLLINCVPPPSTLILYIVYCLSSCAILRALSSK